MNYHDKSTGRTVELRESRTEFLGMAAPDDTEAVNPVLDQRVFSVIKSTNRDGVFLFRVKSEEESPVEITRALDNLRANRSLREVAPALIDADGQARFALPGRVLVRVRDMSAEEVARYLASVRSALLRRFGGSELYEAALPVGVEMSAFIDTLNANDHVVFAEPSFYGVDDIEVRVTITVAEAPRSGEGEAVGASPTLTWNLRKLAVESAWTRTRGRPDMVVAVIDGMPETAHEAIAAKMVGPVGDDFVFSDDRAVSSHATNICSVIAGESERVSGVAPNVRLAPCIVNLRSQVYAERAAAIDRVTKAARDKRLGRLGVGRIVLCCSWRTSGDIAAIRTAFQDAVTAGVPVVCSAGNEDSQLPHYPSEYAGWPGPLGEGVISVAATDQDDRKADYSNSSASVSVAAPGGNGLPLDARDILCADQSDSYVYAAGTSIACPHVAAVAALLLSADPLLTPKEVKQHIMRTADAIDTQNPGYRGTLGSGRVNAARALAAVTGRRASPPPPAATQAAAGGIAHDGHHPSYSVGPRATFSAAWSNPRPI